MGKMSHSDAKQEEIQFKLRQVKIKYHRMHKQIQNIEITEKNNPAIWKHSTSIVQRSQIKYKQQGKAMTQ